MNVESLFRDAFKQLAGSAGWALEVTPPLPVAWPGNELVYYAFGRRLKPGLIDGCEVAAPWARASRGALNLR
jgi:hypothetical protein